MRKSQPSYEQRPVYTAVEKTYKIYNDTGEHSIKAYSLRYMGAGSIILYDDFYKELAVFNNVSYAFPGDTDVSQD